MTTNTWIDKWFERRIQYTIQNKCSWKKNIQHKNDIEQTSGAKMEDKKKFEFIDLLLSLLFSILKWIYEKLSGIWLFCTLIFCSPSFRFQSSIQFDQLVSPLPLHTRRSGKPYFDVISQTDEASTPKCIDSSILHYCSFAFL